MTRQVSIPTISGSEGQADQPKNKKPKQTNPHPQPPKPAA